MDPLYSLRCGMRHRTAKGDSYPHTPRSMHVSGVLQLEWFGASEFALIVEVCLLGGMGSSALEGEGVDV